MFYDGIDHGALEATMRMLGIKSARQRQVFMHVHILEAEARVLRNES